MKSTISLLLTFCFTGLLSSSALAADSKGAALSECKAHMDGLYQEGLRTKLKRIKKRGGDFEVKMKVSSEGEKFNAVCAFSDSGMTYTTDQASSTIAD